MALPKFIALELTTNQNYLCCAAEGTQGDKGLLRFSGELVTSPYSKFEVEMAESDTTEGLVHIRCCYNNKYWVNLKHPNRITALAKQRNEDRSQPSCTLFKPEISSRCGKTVVRFLHARTNICLSVDSEFRLIVGDEKNDSSWFSVVDWHTLVVLPHYVAFKGKNGRYLNDRFMEGHGYLQFSSSDIGDRSVQIEIFYNKDGSIRLITHPFRFFWMRHLNYIWSETEDESGKDPNTWFSVVKVNFKTIALRNLGTQGYCRSLSVKGLVDCLDASEMNINRSTHLEAGT